MLKPIETVYNDYRFRSRLEARWAVFFDTLGVNYEYEKEGFDLYDAGWYLPDYWLPKQQVWVEIKGQEPGEIDTKRYCALAYYSESPVYVFTGEINPNIFAGFAHPSHLPEMMAYLVSCMTWHECLKCREIVLDGREAINHSQCGGKLQRDSIRLLAAYREARQARFEHQ